MKNYKNLALTFISCFPALLTFACGGGWYSADYYNVFEQDLMLEENLGPTHHKSDYYDQTWFLDDNIQNDNLEEWRVFFNKKYDLTFLKNLIYNDKPLSVAGITGLLKYSDDKTKNSFAKYLKFAKDCEKISTAADPWSYWDDEEEVVDMALINRLVKDGSTLSRMEKDPFLSERYHFQLMKLYYYGERYEKAIASYDEYYHKESSKSIMKYWALDYKAGAQMQLGYQAEANHNFLKVFDNCPSRRSTAYYSITFSDEKGFNQVLDLCENDDEKAVFHFVRGVNRNSVVLEDLKEVINYSANSEYAEILMANELVKMEHIYWPLENQMGEGYWTDVKHMPMVQLNKYIDDFVALVEAALPRMENQEFWNISLAYLYTLQKKYSKSQQLLATINTKNVNYEKQIANIDLVNYLFLHPKLTEEDENNVGNKWYALNDGEVSLGKNAWTDFGSVNGLIANYLFSYYQNETAKAFLFSGETSSSFRVEYDEKLDVDLIHDLRVSMENAKKTVLFQYAEENFLESNLYENVADGLKEVEATLYMRDKDGLKEAIKLFKELPITPDIETNPFNMEIRDCIGGGWYDDEGCNHKPTSLNKLSLAEKLLIMTKKAKEGSAIDAYLLGNAYYNMTYFGHAWSTLSYFRSGSSYTGFTDCSAALHYYEMTIKLSEEDREMQAKSNFMAAKCEQNLYFTDNNEDGYYGYYISENWDDPIQGIIDYNEEVRMAGHKVYFDNLEQNYSDTKFYQEAIQECSYFDIYVHF